MSFSPLSVFFLIVVFLLAGVAIGFFWRKFIIEAKKDSIEELSQRIIEEAQREATTIKKDANLQAKETIYQMTAAFEKETHERRSEQKRLEQRLNQKEENLERKLDQISQRESEVTKQESALSKFEKNLEFKSFELEKLVDSHRKKLEEVAAMSSEQAKDILLKAMEEEARYEGAKMIRRIEQESREAADKKAKEIIALSVSGSPGITWPNGPFP